MKPTAILLLHCPDQPGIISEMTRFITDNQGNIVYLDQYVDRQDGIFFMRMEWELDEFLIPRDKIKEYLDTLYALKDGILRYERVGKDGKRASVHPVEANEQ